MRCALAGDEAQSLLLALGDASVAQLAEVERAARDYPGEDVAAIARAELVARLGRGEFVLVDVRPAEEYAAGHIEAARSIPLDELEGAPPDLPGAPPDLPADRRDRWVLPWPVLRVRARGGCTQPTARPAASRPLAWMASRAHRRADCAGG